MSEIGIVHLVFSMTALVLGTVVVLLPKATRWHRTFGHGYVWCMLGIVGTSFAMYDLTGRVTPFHFAALVALVSVVVGTWSVLARRPGKEWIEVHATVMTWSYVGLWAAFVAESLTRFAMPLLADVLERSALWPAFWVLVGAGSFLAIGIGAALIRRRLPGAIRAVPAAKRRDREALQG